MLKPAALLASLAFATTFATPALALYEYYVVQNKSTKACEVVEERPTAAPMIVVGDGHVYRTKSEAQGAMKLIPECR